MHTKATIWSYESRNNIQTLGTYLRRPNEESRENLPLWRVEVLSYDGPSQLNKDS